MIAIVEVILKKTGNRWGRYHLTKNQEVKNIRSKA